MAGVRLRGDEDLFEAVREQVHGTGPWTNWHDDVTALDGLERAIDAAGPVGSQMGRALVCWLDAPDVAARSIAVAAATRAARHIGVRALVDVLARCPDLFGGVVPSVPTSHPDLRWALLQAISEAVEQGDVEAIEVLRAAMCEERGYWLVRGVARADLAWLLEHAAEVLPKSALGAGLRAMPDTASRLELIRRLGPWSPSEKQAADAQVAIWSLLEDRDVVRAALRDA